MSMRQWLVRTLSLFVLIACNKCVASCLPTNDKSPTAPTRSATLPSFSEEAGMTLSLREAIRLALVFDPSIRQTWATTARRTAEVGVARAAYLPVIEANASVSRVKRHSRAEGAAGNVTSRVENEDDQGINLTWRLLDFGSRDARLDETGHRLAAATAAQDADLQRVAFDVAHAYYSALEAKSLWRTAWRVEQLSLDSVVAACARHDAGVGTLADVLQARTAHGRAELARLHAATSAVSRMGRLAALINVDMSTTFVLESGVAGEEEGEPDGTVDALAPMQSVDALLALAKQQHPALRAASAEVEAEQARRDAIRDAWGPSVTLVGGVNRETRHGAFAFDGPATAASVGIQLTIPLYDGGDRRYRTAAAIASIDVAQAKKMQTERRIAMDVWQHYRALSALSARRSVEKRLLGDARQSFEMSRGRYREGAGSMEALVTAQAALADAEYAIVASRIRWLILRLRLALSLGQLDVQLPDLKPPAFPPPPDPEIGINAHRPNTPH